MKIMSHVDIDVVPEDNETPAQTVASMRKIINEARDPNGIHAKMITAVDANGNVEVRLTCYSAEKLITWLRENGYKDYEKFVVNQHPNRVPRNK